MRFEDALGKHTGPGEFMVTIRSNPGEVMEEVGARKTPRAGCVRRGEICQWCLKLLKLRVIEVGL